MTTVSVPLNATLEIAVNHLVKSGYGSNKADVIRRAITRASEDEAVETVLRSEREIREGKGLRGDLRELAKKIR